MARHIDIIKHWKGVAELYRRIPVEEATVLDRYSPGNYLEASGSHSDADCPFKDSKRLDASS